MKTSLSVVALILAGVALGFAVFGEKAGVPSLGASAGPSVDFPSFTVNGAETFYNKASIAKQSRILCSIKSPSATSTLVSSSVRIDVGTSTASTIHIAKAATATATTTLLGTAYTLGSGVQVTLNASSTDGQAGGANIFAPNTYFNVGMQGGDVGGSLTGLVPSGACAAVFLAS